MKRAGEPQGSVHRGELGAALPESLMIESETVLATRKGSIHFSNKRDAAGKIRVGRVSGNGVSRCDCRTIAKCAVKLLRVVAGALLRTRGRDQDSALENVEHSA
jgi:hypothetical protein